MRLVRVVLIGLAAVGVMAAPSSAQRVVSDATDPPGTSAAALGLVPLEGERSRQDLFAEVRRAAAADSPADAAAGSEYFNLYGPFRFPNDAVVDAVLHQPRTDSIFGVDISHYTAASFPIEELHRRQVSFLYMKATQGAVALDARFAGFWARAGKLPSGSEVHRGAYHFLSAGDPHVAAEAWGAAQARTFLKVLHANGGIRATDMPPVVDLEWDKTSASGADRWQARPAADIIKMVAAFLTVVEADTGRTPVIYTARAWWRGRIKSDAMIAPLAKYPLWLADYSKTSQASEQPPTIGSRRWALWQYTEQAKMAIGFNPGFDASIFKGGNPAFYTGLGVAPFP